MEAETSSRPSLLLLDASGVVVTAEIKPFVAAAASALGGSPAEALRRYAETRTAFWTGALDEAGFFAEVLGVTDPAPWRARFIATVSAGPAAARLRAWAAAVPVWLLSNHRSDWLTATLEVTGARRHLSRVYVSDALGFAKPDPRAFAGVLDHFAGAPGEVLFVDDTPRNVEAAERLGCRGVVADPAGAFVRVVDAALGLPNTAPGRT